MCGIAGYLGNFNNSPDNKIIKRTLKIMSTRGPDDKNYFVKNINTKNLTLLHSRLSIIDPSKKASQPFMDNNGVLIFNGAIYNYLELRQQLKKNKIKFSSKSDTEVLLKYLNFYGTSKLDQLEGMWSFAYFNFKKKKLILSRDRFGEKPLYYQYSKSNLIFGSNLNYITSISNYKNYLNKKKIEEYIKLGWGAFLTSNDTFYEKVFALEPGTYLEKDLGSKLKLNKYWHPKRVKIKKNLNFKNEEKSLKKQLFSEIKKKLRTDFSIACLLSGGIDSSTIASVSNKIISKKIDCFSIKPLDKNYDENELIKKNIKHIGCSHKYINIDKNGSFKELKDIINKTSSVVPSVTWLLFAIMCKQIKKLGYKVVLSGIGGDEMFGGYYIHHLHYLKSIMNKKNFKKQFDFWKKKTAIHIRSNDLKDFKNYIKKNKLKNKGFYEILELSKYFHRFDISKIKSKNFLSDSFKNELYKDLFKQRLPVQLYGADNISMYYGLETRCPFLSKDVYSKSFSFPNNFLINDGMGKVILRSSMKGIVEKSILNSTNKIGFFANLKNFFEINSKQFRKTLFSNNYVNSIIKKDKISKLLVKKELTNQETHLIFNILNVVIFCNQKKSKFKY